MLEFTKFTNKYYRINGAKERLEEIIDENDDDIKRYALEVIKLIAQYQPKLSGIIYNTYNKYAIDNLKNAKNDDYVLNYIHIYWENKPNIAISHHDHYRDERNDAVHIPFEYFHDLENTKQKILQWVDDQNKIKEEIVVKEQKDKAEKEYKEYLKLKNKFEKLKDKFEGEMETNDLAE